MFWRIKDNDHKDGQHAKKKNSGNEPEIHANRDDNSYGDKSYQDWAYKLFL